MSTYNYDIYVQTKEEYCFRGDEQHKYNWELKKLAERYGKKSRVELVPDHPYVSRYNVVIATDKGDFIIETTADEEFLPIKTLYMCYRNSESLYDIDFVRDSHSVLGTCEICEKELIKLGVFDVNDKMSTYKYPYDHTSYIQKEERNSNIMSQHKYNWTLKKMIQSYGGKCFIEKISEHPFTSRYNIVVIFDDDNDFIIETLSDDSDNGDDGIIESLDMYYRNSCTRILYEINFKKIYKCDGYFDKFTIDKKIEYIFNRYSTYDI